MEASAQPPQQPTPPFSEDAKKLLDGVIETEHQAHFSLLTTHAGTLMVLAIVDGETEIKSYEDCKAFLDKYVETDELNRWVEVRTFIWTGERATEMWTHRKYVRVGWIVEAIEVTDEQWRAYVTDHVQRQFQAAANRLSQQGIQMQ